MFNVSKVEVELDLLTYLLKKYEQDGNPESADVTHFVDFCREHLTAVRPHSTFVAANNVGITFTDKVNVLVAPGTSADIQAGTMAPVAGFAPMTDVNLMMDMQQASAMQGAVAITGGSGRPVKGCINYAAKDYPGSKQPVDRTQKRDSIVYNAPPNRRGPVDPLNPS